MTRQARERLIGYVDLFAGSGRFEGGSESIPLLILRKAVADPFVSKALKSFNDKNPEELTALQREITGIDGIGGPRSRATILL